jgi:hypothetical protein
MVVDGHLTSVNIGAMHQSSACCNCSCFIPVKPQIFLIMKTSLFCFNSKLQVNGE